MPPADRPRRPWRVFVQQIGPTFSFADEAAAHERAAQLVGDGWHGDTFGVVDVYNAHNADLTRTRYRDDAPPERQGPGGFRYVDWVPAPAPELAGTQPEAS